jgi:probable HAF family extracellular repeat protein
MLHNTMLKLSGLCLLGSWQMIHADAFLDVNGVYTTFNVPGAEPDSTVATSINNLGQIAGYFVNSDGSPEGFVDTNGVFTTFAPPTPPFRGSYFDVTGINDGGQIVGNASVGPSTVEGFLYTNGAYTIVPLEGAVAGINDSGQIIGYEVVGSGSIAEIGVILNSSGGVTNLLYIPGSPYTLPKGISNTGEVVGWAVYSESTAYWTWQNGVFTTIALPGPPLGINSSGQIIGDLASEPEQSYLDTNGVIQIISVPGSLVTYAYGINDAGEIVGLFNPAVIPEPASLLLIASGLAGLVSLRRYLPRP